MSASTLRLLLTIVAFDGGMRAAMALGVTGWRDWPPGDAHDIGFVCAGLVWLLIGRISPPSPSAEGPGS